MKVADFSERLKIALEARGMYASQLGAVCKINKSTLSQYLSGKYEAKYARIVQMAEVLGCDPLWLAGNDVPMTPGAGEYGAEINPACMLPVIGDVAAGAGVIAEDNITGYEFADPRFCNGEYFYLRVNGDSMSPWISSGDRVLCRRQDTLLNGQIGIFIVDEEGGVVKEYEEHDDMICLISYGSGYRPRVFSGSERARVRIVGRVVQSVRDW